MTKIADHVFAIARMLNAAVEKADAADRELRTITTIKLEPGGFIISMECRNRLACGFGTHTVARTCGYGVLHDTDPHRNGLIGAIREVAVQMLDDRDDYARRKKSGELTS